MKYLLFVLMVLGILGCRLTAFVNPNAWRSPTPTVTPTVTPTPDPEGEFVRGAFYMCFSLTRKFMGLSVQQANEFCTAGMYVADKQDWYKEKIKGWKWPLEPLPTPTPTPGPTGSMSNVSSQITGGR